MPCSARQQRQAELCPTEQSPPGSGGAASGFAPDYDLGALRGNTGPGGAISGLVNGAGSLGAIFQGYLTPKVVDALGWRGLYNGLGGAMLVATLALGPAVALERNFFSRKRERA